MSTVFLIKTGAGDRNRTDNISLEGWGFTTKLHPHYIIVNYGAPDRSRTHNLLIRSQTLYPIELRAPGIFGAAERTWTSTGLPPLGPQPSASAIPPRPLHPTIIIIHLWNNLSTWKLVSHEGLEPSTLWLKVRCSTNWANGSKWLGYLDSNQGMTESKSVALPLGYSPIIKY